MDRLEQLIEILRDKSAREDEKHDAAMDIGYYNDERALEALYQIVYASIEDPIIIEACVESIMEIWIQRGLFDVTALKKFNTISKSFAHDYLKNIKPEWLHFLNDQSY